MSSHKTHTYDVEDCDDDYYDKYDKYDDFSIHQNMKSNNKKQKMNVYSSKHVRNYIKRYNK